MGNSTGEKTAGKIAGWEVARDLEGTKKTIWERMIPEWNHIKAAGGGGT